MKEATGTRPRTTLTIDQGNTSTKATLFADKEGADRGEQILFSERLDAADIEGLARIIEQWRPCRAILSCVGHLDLRTTETLRRFMEDRLLVLTHRTPLPIRIDYRTPSSLGLDRIAAACGAAALLPGRPFLIADAGTALTLDLLDSEATFRGGNISPGMKIRFASLHSFTEALPETAPDGPHPRFGASTDEAIRSGVLFGMAEEIAGSLQAARRICPGADLLLTGGDAPLLLPLLNLPDAEIIAEPRLVAIGLNRILNYNEDI